MSPMTPKMSVSPAAIRNSITPSYTPFRICSMTRMRDMPCPCLSRPAARCATGHGNGLHLALGRVGVGMILERDTYHLVGEHLALLDDLAGMDVLHRVLVGAKGEIAAGAVEIGGAQRLAKGVGVRHVDLFHGRDQQVRRVESLARVERRQTVIPGLEALDKGGIGRVVEV